LYRYNKALFDANDALGKLRAEFELELAQLRLAVRQAEGKARFVPEMTVREVLMAHPQAEQVLAGFHLGGCSHCAVEPDDTLAGACQEHGVDLSNLIQNLNLLATGQSANGAPQLVKLPNVALEF
jgi:hybrid cluster-associated redox disulfide protein